MKFKVTGSLQITVTIDREIEAKDPDEAYAEVMASFDPTLSDVTVTPCEPGHPRIRVQTRTEVKDV